MSHGGEVHLMAFLIELCRAVEPQAHDLFGENADDACVHALGALRNGVATPEREGIALGVGRDQVIEQSARGAVLQVLDELDDRADRLLVGGQLLCDVGDETRQQICCRMIPKRLVVVLDGADCLCHREDVLLVGPAVRLAANMPQGVVAAALDAVRKGRGVVKIGEVEALHKVAVGRQYGTHFATERALGIEHDIACIHLQQVGLEDVSGLAGSRRADHERVVVEPRLAGVAGQ